MNRSELYSCILDRFNIVPIAAPSLSATLQARLNSRTKPLGSLGMLESIALQAGLIYQSETPKLRLPHIIVLRATMV